MTETAEARLKRMRMRSWRRGTKEMDLILGPYADARLATMAEAWLLLYDLVLDLNDQDLLPMMLGQAPAPAGLQDIVSDIALFATTRLLADNSTRN